MLAYLQQQRRTMVIFTNNRHFLGIKKCWIELKKKILYSLLHNLPKRYLMDSQIAWKMHACTRFKFFFLLKKWKKKCFLFWFSYEEVIFWFSYAYVFSEEKNIYFFIIYSELFFSLLSTSMYICWGTCI